MGQVNYFKITRSIDNFRGQLQAIIAELPNNENIQVLGANSFTISSSEFTKHDNFSPRYHSFKPQYEAFIRLIDKVHIENLMKRMRGMIEGKRIEDMNLHPEVIKRMTEILDAFEK